MMVPPRKQQDLCHFIRTCHWQHLRTVSLAFLQERFSHTVKDVQALMRIWWTFVCVAYDGSHIVG